MSSDIVVVMNKVWAVSHKNHLNSGTLINSISLVIKNEVAFVGDTLNARDNFPPFADDVPKLLKS